MSKGAMSKRMTESDETFTQAAWDALRDAEHEYAVLCTVNVLPLPRRGVWRVEMSAMGTRLDDALRIVARIAGDYPNSRAASLSAYLFSQANSISQMCESARAEEERMSRKRA